MKETKLITKNVNSFIDVKHEYAPFIREDGFIPYKSDKDELEDVAEEMYKELQEETKSTQSGNKILLYAALAIGIYSIIK